MFVIRQHPTFIKEDEDIVCAPRNRGVYFAQF